MGWVYLDDKFPEHQKVVAAGGDAAWLFVCLLAYCRRNRTGGKVPKRLVPQLSDRKAPQKLAAKLVGVELIEDDGEFWQIHEYDHWNQTEMRERMQERGRKAARARWQTDASSNAQAMLQASDGECIEQCSSNAKAMPARAFPNPHPQSPLLTSPIPLQVVRHSDGEIDDRLETRVITTCTGSNKPLVAREAAEILVHLRRHVDDRLIDEAVGTYAQAAQKPVLPRAIAKVCAQMAAKRGVHVPEFVPSKRNTQEAS